MIMTCWVPGLLLILGSAPVDGDDGIRRPGPSRSRDESDVKVEPSANVVDVFARTRASRGYKTAYRKGRDEARASIESGRARLLSFGMLGVSDLDPETGLSVVSIAGCAVSAEVLGRVEGNNGRIRAWVQEHGPTPNALLRWTDELSDLPTYFDARARAGSAIRLEIGGPALTSPDGRFTIRQVAVRVEKGAPPDARTLNTVGLEVNERGAIHKALIDVWGDGLTDLVWGPPGAPFAVVKSRGDDGANFQVLHLRPVDWVIPRELSRRHHLGEHPGGPVQPTPTGPPTTPSSRATAPRPAP